MPNRILKYLDEMDQLRDETDQEVDKMLKRINVKSLLIDPNRAMKVFVLEFLKKKNGLFKRARVEGKKLANSLNRT
jgi:hypothetical protein